MKAISYVVVLGLLWSVPALAQTISSGDQARIQQAAEVVRAMRDTSDNGIPDELWQKAHCVIVLPDVKKAALGIGGEFGKGVMSCRTAKGWSAPVFMELAKGSFGLQIGAQETELVLLVMNKNGIDKMLRDKVTLGADASVAAGPVGRTGTAATDLKLNAEILSYSRSRGLFAGIDISGGALKPDKDSNAELYGASVAPYDIVAGARAATVPAQVRPFVNALESNARATTGIK